jgi:hypothetical protein
VRGGHDRIVDGDAGDEAPEDAKSKPGEHFHPPHERRRVF